MNSLDIYWYLNTNSTYHITDIYGILHIIVSNKNHEIGLTWNLGE